MRFSRYVSSRALPHLLKLARQSEQLSHKESEVLDYNMAHLGDRQSAKGEPGKGIIDASYFDEGNAGPCASRSIRRVLLRIMESGIVAGRGGSGGSGALADYRGIQWRLPAAVRAKDSGATRVLRFSSRGAQPGHRSGNVF